MRIPSFQYDLSLFQAHVPPTPTESKPSTEKKEAVWRPMKADSDITLSQITKNTEATEEGGSEAKKEAVAVQPERPLSESTAGLSDY